MRKLVVTSRAGGPSRASMAGSDDLGLFSQYLDRIDPDLQLSAHRPHLDQANDGQLHIQGWPEAIQFGAPPQDSDRLKVPSFFPFSLITQRVALTVLPASRRQERCIPSVRKERCPGPSFQRASTAALVVR